MHCHTQVGDATQSRLGIDIYTIDCIYVLGSARVGTEQRLVTGGEGPPMTASLQRRAGRRPCRANEAHARSLVLFSVFLDPSLVSLYIALVRDDTASAVQSCPRPIQARR